MSVLLKALEDLLDAFAKQVAVEVVNSMNASVDMKSVRPTSTKATETEKAVEDKPAKKKSKPAEKKAAPVEKVIVPVKDAEVEVIDLEAEDEAEEITYTLLDVRKALSTLAKKGKRAEVNALIKKYDSNKLSEVKEEDYASLMADAEAL